MAKTDVKVDIRKIALTIDMGGSKTKAIVQEYPEGEPFVLLLDSEVADVAKASVEGIDPEGNPASRAWVGIGGEYYVLGDPVYGEVAKISDCMPVGLLNPC